MSEFKGTKGDYKGECNRKVCKNLNATFYNFSTRMFYCESCANEINYWSKRDSNIILCTEQLIKQATEV